MTDKESVRGSSRGPGPHGGITSLRDVARRAGVSVSTASRVLSGSSHPVSEATRKLVLEAAEELGFEPNRLARALATARSQTIGVVVHDVSDPYFAEIVRGLEDVAGASQYALFVSSSDRELDKEVAVLRAFVASQVDAIVLVASGMVGPEYLSAVSEVLGRFESLGGVVVSTSETSYPAPRVVFDNAGATRTMVEHLVELGHRQIAYLDGPEELQVCERRLAGFKAALDTHGIPFDPSLVEPGGFSIEGGARACARLIERARPTAILAANDLMAIGALETLGERGIRVPEDVSVAGFDDIEFAAHAAVPLTTVRVPLAELGRLGARLALDLLEGRPPATLPSAESELVVRKSTARVSA